MTNPYVIRDAYILVDLYADASSLSKGDYVEFSDEDVFNGETGVLVGEINSIDEDCYYASQTVEVLRRDGVSKATTSTYVMLNAKDIVRLGVCGGRVEMTTKYSMIISTGPIMIPEEMLMPIPKETTYEEGITLEELNDLFATIQDVVGTSNTEERKEENNMNNLFSNFGFGKLNGDRFKLSMNGIAVRQANTDKYVVYNKDNNEFVDATNLLFDIKDALFILPAVEVNVGDTVIHENKAYFIVENTNEIKAVSYEDCTQTVLIPKSTMFGIKYFTKVFSMFGDNFAATGDLFSNPMMLMALMEGKNGDLSQLMLLSSLTKGDLGSNPMALAMMLKGDNSSDSLSTIALMSMFNNGTNPFAPKKEAKKTNNKEN